MTIHWLMAHWGVVLLTLYLASVVALTAVVAERRDIENALWGLLAVATMLFWPITLAWVHFADWQHRRNLRRGVNAFYAEIPE